MFGFLTKKDGDRAGTGFQAVSAPIGQRGICAYCGSIKSGSFVQCNNCGFQPIKADDLAQSILLNEGMLGQRFERAVLEMQRGRFIKFSDEKYSFLDEKIAEVKRALSLDSPSYKNRQLSEDNMRNAAQTIILHFNEIIDAHPAFFSNETVSIQKTFAILAFFLLDEAKKRAVDEGERAFMSMFYKNRMIFLVNFHSLHHKLGRSPLEFNQCYLELHEHLSTLVDFDEVAKYGLYEWMRIVGTAFVMNDNMAAIQSLEDSTCPDGIAPIASALISEPHGWPR